MISTLKRNIARYITNFPGWRTNRKIVVIESDDWGSIRMPSKQVYEQCLQAGYRVDEAAYERFDSLASEEDLELLFDVLTQYKDRRGRPAVITANMLAANPNFNKIREAGYKQYFYELITETFKRYPKHSGCFDLWLKGKNEGIFFPQCHGREHLNVSMFMEALQRGDRDAHFGFEHNMPGCISKMDAQTGNRFVESLRYSNQQDKKKKLSIIVEGLELFESLMGYHSETFIPPNYLWSPDYDATLSAAVQFYQGQRKLIEPLIHGGVKLHPHRLGEENKHGQTYLVRNAFFEPALYPNGDPVQRCLHDIATAFRMHKPAIVCSHRINYVGYIDEKNRDRNLKLLECLLCEILMKWPEVEFLNSAQLGNLIVSKNR